MKNKKVFNKKKILILLVVIFVAFAIILLFVNKNNKNKVMECTIVNNIDDFVNITSTIELVYDEYVVEQNMQYTYQITNNELKQNISTLVQNLKNEFNSKFGVVGIPYTITNDENTIYVSIDLNLSELDKNDFDKLGILFSGETDNIKQTTIDEVVTSIESGGGICAEK